MSPPHLDVQMGDVSVMSEGESLQELEHEALDILKVIEVYQEIFLAWTNNWLGADEIQLIIQKQNASGDDSKYSPDVYKLPGYT